MTMFDQKGIKPMLLTESHEPIESPDYLCELKLDGIRCLAYLDDHTDLRNKRDIPLARAFPELSSIHLQAKERCILDGELIVTAPDGSPDFEAMQMRSMLTDAVRIKLEAARKPASFVTFDILLCGNTSLIDLPLTERKRILNETIAENGRIAISRTFENSRALFELTTAQGLEGIVLKRKDGLYHPGRRSRDWIKVKNLIDEDFVACGYIVKGDLCSLVLGKYVSERLQYQGHVTLGVSKAEAERYPADGICPFAAEPPNHTRAKWYAPLQVCTVRYMERTSNGSLRQPRLRGFRSDKRPSECQ